MAEVSDYYMGRLIINDDNPDETMHWVVYDGLQRVRCTSKAAAMRYCQERALGVTEDAIQGLMLAYDKIRNGYMQLDKLARMVPAVDRPTIETISVNVRRIADQLDTYIAQQCSLRNNKLRDTWQGDTKDK